MKLLFAVCILALARASQDDNQRAANTEDDNAPFYPPQFDEDEEIAGTMALETFPEADITIDFDQPTTTSDHPGYVEDNRYPEMSRGTKRKAEDGPDGEPSPKKQKTDEDTEISAAADAGAQAVDIGFQEVPEAVTDLWEFFKPAFGNFDDWTTIPLEWAFDQESGMWIGTPKPQAQTPISPLDKTRAAVEDATAGDEQAPVEEVPEGKYVRLDWSFDTRGPNMSMISALKFYTENAGGFAKLGLNGLNVFISSWAGGFKLLMDNTGDSTAKTWLSEYQWPEPVEEETPAAEDTEDVEMSDKCVDCGNNACISCHKTKGTRLFVTGCVDGSFNGYYELKGKKNGKNYYENGSHTIEWGSYWSSFWDAHHPAWRMGVLFQADDGDIPPTEGWKGAFGIGCPAHVEQRGIQRSVMWPYNYPQFGMEEKQLMDNFTFLIEQFAPTSTFDEFSIFVPGFEQFTEMLIGEQKDFANKIIDFLKSSTEEDFDFEAKLEEFWPKPVVTTEAEDPEI